MKSFSEFILQEDKRKMSIKDRIDNHPAVETYHPNYGEHYINLKPGYHWSGQHSFGAETSRKAYSLLKQVEKE